MQQLSPETDSSIIRLSEYQPQRLHLSPQDRQYLADRFSGRIRCSLEVFEDETFDVLDPGPNVGVLTLPSGRRVECRPKVDAANIFYMLAVAHELPALEEELALFGSFDELLEFVVARFASLTEDRIRKGLYRRYLEREENLGMVRGRILTTQDVRANFALRHRTYCEFSELSWDIPENQVIRQVAYQMSGWSLRPELRSRLRQIEGVMGEVSPTYFPATVVDTFVYSRLNYEYEPVHQLCRLLLDAASLHEDSGEYEFQTFLVNMNELFETYIAKVLDQALVPPLSVYSQSNGRLDLLGRVTIIPDIVIRARQKLRCVLDTKYKRLDQGEFKNHDLYQVLAYCTALETNHGMLIYPKHLVDFEQDVLIRNSDVTIRQMTIDLGGNVEHLRQESQRLADAVHSWVATDS